MLSLGSGASGCVGADEPGASSDNADERGVLDLADVSFLFPLPERFADRGLLMSMSEDSFELLSRDVFRQIAAVQPLAPVPAEEPGRSLAIDDQYDRLRVVGGRLAGPTSLRLVVQPIIDDGGQLTTDDASLHLVFNLKLPEQEAAHRAIRDLALEHGALTAGQPLAPHPVMALEGPDGDYARAVKQLIRDAVVRRPDVVAFMARNELGNVKTFGVKPANGDAQTAVSFTEQRTAPGGPTRSGVAGPEPGAPDIVGPLLRSDEIAALSEQALLAEVEKTLHLDNPDRTAVATSGCVSCHAATRARLFGASPELIAEAGDGFAGVGVDRPEPYGNDTFVLRAFGYFGREPAITQRVVNESAKVARQLAALP